MKIAVTYDNGNIFQHFGRTETFKVYEVEDGKVVSTEVLGSNGAGHGALAGVLAENTIDVLLCGGMGPGAQNALMGVGIEVVTGCEGDADAAVEAYLKGELETAGVTCHHHEEGHVCGDHEEGGCSCGEDSGCDCGEGGCDCGDSGCGCGSGCGCHAPMMEGKNVGKTVKVHYVGTLNDGTQFDSSYDRGEPLQFLCGAGMMIKGFDQAVANMEVGEVVNVHLMPEEAYGPVNPGMIITVPVADLQGSDDLNVGEKVYLSNAYGQQFLVTVTAKENGNITFDANHEMAGKELNFKIELVEAL